jgi:uncharacterized protein
MTIESNEERTSQRDQRAFLGELRNHRNALGEFGEGRDQARARKESVTYPKEVSVMYTSTGKYLRQVLLGLLIVLAAALMLAVASARANAAEVKPTQTGSLQELFAATTSAEQSPDPRYLLSHNRTYEQYLYAVKQNIESFWAPRFANAGMNYSAPSLQLFYDTIYMPGCGIRYVSQGPVFCGTYNPYTQTIYWPPWWTDGQGYRIDQYGDFATAFVMAHEEAHNVQYWSGIDLQAPYQELQADCLGGVWANSQYYVGYLENGDIQEALNLAYAIGDDYVGGDHGTPNQRYNALWLGYYYGNSNYCTPDYLSFPASSTLSASTEDHTNPEITGLRPTGRTHDRTPAISATVRDAEGKLVKSYIKLYLDGKKIGRFSYDQGTGKLRYAAGKLGFGKHNVKVVATDIGHNTATKTWSFKVVR